RGYMIVFPDLPPSKGETLVLANLPEVAWYRHPRFMIPALLGAALFILWGSWTVTKDASAPSAASAVPVIVSRGPSVAVLPFENNAGDAGREMLAEGLTQGLISALGRFGELRVLARGATSAYRGRVPNAIDLGRTLGVDYAVDGDVRRDSDV